MSYRGRGSYRSSGSGRGGWGGESRGRSSDRGGRSNRNGGHFFKEPSSSYRGYHNEREKFSNYHDDSHYSRGRQQHDSYPPRRERSHQRGGTPERKRMRTDTYSSVGSSHSRDHDSYGGRIYHESSNDRVVFREERRSVRGDHRSSEYAPYRKSGPPPHAEPRFTSPRGGRGSRGGSSFRGRSSSYRGVVRSSFTKPIRSKPVFAVSRRPRTEFSSRGRSAALLKKKREQEIILKYKRLKLQRQKWRRAILAKKSQSAKDDSDEDGKKEGKADEEEEETEEMVEEVVEEEVEEEVEEDAPEEGSKEEAAEETKTGEEGEDKEEKKKEVKPKVKKVVKKIIKKVVKKPVKKAATSNGPVKTEGSAEKSTDATSEKKATSKKEDSPVRKNSLGQPFIKLECPQCEDRYITFRDYDKHLSTSKHKAAMRNRSLDLKKKLARIRLKQREEQREIDEKLAAEGKTHFKTLFCETCKLMYKQKRVEHNDSDKHKKTKILLNPYCRPCRARFMSPMQYEMHIASLDHIQQKTRVEEYEARKAKEKEEGKDVNMDNFMVLDSVGSGDEESAEDTEEKTDGKEGTTEEGEKKKKKPKVVNLGSEYCKKIEVYYCELCRMQVPRSNTLENALALHCRNRLHLRKYIRARDDRALRKKAEKIHREKEEDEKKEKKAAETAKKVKGEGDTSVNANSDEKAVKQEEECDSEAEGKFWKEIESDLPDISDDLGENKSSDDEDGCNSRYDRFNTNKNDKPIKTESVPVEEKEATEEQTGEESAVKEEANEVEETKAEK